METPEDSLKMNLSMKKISCSLRKSRCLKFVLTFHPKERTQKITLTILFLLQTGTFLQPMIKIPNKQKRYSSSLLPSKTQTSEEGPEVSLQTHHTYFSRT
jgi:hypothetical protein